VRAAPVWWASVSSEANRSAGSALTATMLTTWGSDFEPTSDNVHNVIGQWWKSLPELTRSNIHSGDKRKLENSVKEPGDDFVGMLAGQMQGGRLEDWSEQDLHHFLGRLQSAKEDLESWQQTHEPPPGPGRVLMRFRDGTYRLISGGGQDLE